MGMSIGGLISGIDTQAMIDQLIQVESIPQILLENQVSKNSTFISGLQQLNSSISALATKTKELAKPESLATFAVASTSEGVTATAGMGAVPGNLDIVVDAVATAQTSVTDRMVDLASSSLTITATDGTRMQIDAGSPDLAEVAKAINNADAGVRATRVAAGTDPETGEELYRLQLTATETGTAGAFSIHAGTIAEVEAGTATNLLAADGAAQIRPAADAQVRLFAGTDAEEVLTSATNTFTDLLPGLDVTVSRASEEPVTLTVANDTEAKSQLVKDLVSSLSSIFSFITANTKVTTGPGADGATETKAGLFAGDSTVRDVKNKLITAATDPVEGTSPSEIGIVITRDGTVEFDAERLAQALEEDPGSVDEILAAIASRAHGAAEDLSDKYGGQVTARITGEQKTVDRMSDQILDWDRRLALKRTTLERQWANLEVQLGKMQTTQEWLTNQLASMSTSMIGSPKQ